MTEDAGKAIADACTLLEEVAKWFSELAKVFEAPLKKKLGRLEKEGGYPEPRCGSYPAFWAPRWLATGYRIKCDKQHRVLLAALVTKGELIAGIYEGNCGTSTNV